MIIDNYIIIVDFKIYKKHLIKYYVKCFLYRILVY